MKYVKDFCIAGQLDPFKSMDKIPFFENYWEYKDWVVEYYGMDYCIGREIFNTWSDKHKFVTVSTINPMKKIHIIPVFKTDKYTFIQPKSQFVRWLTTVLLGKHLIYF